MNQKSILVIEDDTGIQAVTKFSLEMDGHWQVTVANCGAEGLLKAKSTIPDVILLDLIMPDMGGMEILEQLQSDSITTNIPIILFTAKLIDWEIIKNEKSNVVGIINKPFDCLTLSAEISKLLDRRFHLAVSSVSNALQAEVRSHIRSIFNVS